jgi:NADPH-dependent ferric siderophore reductase
VSDTLLQPLSPTAMRPSRVQRVRHELKRRALTVLRVGQPSPRVRSVTFGGNDLMDFVSLSFDDHLKLFLPADDGAAPVARDYTPRHFDPVARELTLEFALHGDGPAAAWAAQARPGESVHMGGPRGSFIIPTDLDWHVLVGDHSALPAIARRLEELPAGAAVIAVLQVPHPADRRALTTAAALQLHWVSDAAGCLATVRGLNLPAGEGFAWCAGEASSMAALRQVLVHEKGLDRHAMRVAAYWKQGAVAHHETLAN